MTKTTCQRREDSFGPTLPKTKMHLKTSESRSTLLLSLKVRKHRLLMPTLVISPGIHHFFATQQGHFWAKFYQTNLNIAYYITFKSSFVSIICQSCIKFNLRVVLLWVKAIPTGCDQFNNSTNIELKKNSFNLQFTNQIKYSWGNVTWNVLVKNKIFGRRLQPNCDPNECFSNKIV